MRHLFIFCSIDRNLVGHSVAIYKRKPGFYQLIVIRL